MNVLIVGGTGMLGEPVARRLAADGHHVRVLTRAPERAARLAASCELVRGDVEDAADVEDAVQGCAWVHVNLNGNGDWDLERRGAETVASLARLANVERLSLISGASTDVRNAGFAMTRAKLDAEAAVMRCGVPFQIFRCSMFMEVLPKMLQGDKAVIMGRQPKPLHWLAAADYAAMVARAFTLSGAASKIFHVRGPEALTMEQALRIYAPDAKVSHVPLAVMQLVAFFSGNEELRRVALPLMRYFEKADELGDPAETNALLGAPQTTVAAWSAALSDRQAPVPRQGTMTPRHA